MNSAKRIGMTFATVTASALLCGVTSFAQMQSAPAPTPTPMPNSSQQTEPGMHPVDPNSTGNGQTSPVDKMFVEEALKGGMAEVQLGQLALQKSNNADVKQFAQKMVDDHTKMGEQMKPIAQQIGVKVPDGPSKKDKAFMVKLGALNGEEFDKAYVKDMVKDHKADLTDFKAEAQNGSDPNVKAAAAKGTQIIQQHLDMIQQIAEKDNMMASK